MLVELDVSPWHSGHALVYFVWNGIEARAETHGIVAVASTMERAEMYRNMFEGQWNGVYGDCMEAWIEPREINHAFGHECSKAGLQILAEARKARGPGAALKYDSRFRREGD